jgi:hypothetical protein
MPHRLARLQQEVSGYLDLRDEEQILERITSQDWPGLAMIPTVDMGRGVMATRFFRSGSVVCDYHGPVLKRDQAESLRRSMAAAESNYMYFLKYDSQWLCFALLLVATTDVNPNEEFFFDYGFRSDDEGSRLSFLMS